MKPLLIALGLWLMSCTEVLAYTSPGAAVGYVNDFAGVMTAETKTQIESQLETVEASTSAEIAVVTIDTLGDDTIENYAEKLFQEWGIGKKGKDNGALFLVAIKDRKVRIEVGYGLEGSLTDAQTAKIIREVITPPFKNDDFNSGISMGVEAIVKVVEGEETEVRETVNLAQTADGIGMTVGVLFWVVPLFSWFISVLSRSKSWWLGGVIGAGVGALIKGLTGLTIFGLIGLLIDYLVSQEYKKSSQSGHYPWWIGGNSGFSSGFGGGRRGGFGGFGGGRSGGGGSSGSF